MLISIKVCSFSKLYLPQKILVASLMSDSLILDRISVNFRKTYLSTISISRRGKLMRQLDADTTFFHWSVNVSTIRYRFVYCHTYAALRVEVV